MEYTRVEIVLSEGGWSTPVAVAGPVAGPARGAMVEPTTLAVTSTLMSKRRARGLDVAGALAPGPADVRIGARGKVWGPGGPIGRVTRLWVGRATGHLTHLLVRRGGGPEHIVPAEMIEHVDARALTVKLAGSQLAEFPIFRPDAAIEADVRAALASVLADPRARRAVKVRVDDGQVALAGVVDTVEQVRFAEGAARAVPGVRKLLLDLVAQETLAAGVEALIAPLVAAAVNGHGGVRVLTEHGIIFLEGSVRTAHDREAIERAALGAAGVRVVVNNLLVNGQPPDRAAGTGPLVRNK